jgi:NAD(P)-dependent dehydrogenase (short-subunit alcohol dehydrogenase family)
VIVTGAASGIGAATAARLAEEGATVVGADIAGGDGIETVDVTDEDAVARLVGGAVERHGRLDGVVHAAGVAGGGPVHLVDGAEWARVLAVNLTGTFLVAKHAVRVMLEQPARDDDGQRGSIVTIASVEGLEGTAGGSAYNASKGGVVLLTKNLAIDYGPKGIRANAICPGFIVTPLMEGVILAPGMEDVVDDFRHEHALRRFGEPEEIAAVAAFLLSADASFLSGNAMAVDGGYSAGRDHHITERLGLS